MTRRAISHHAHLELAAPMVSTYIHHDSGSCSGRGGCSCVLLLFIFSLISGIDKSKLSHAVLFAEVVLSTQCIHVYKLSQSREKIILFYICLGN